MIAEARACGVPAMHKGITDQQRLEEESGDGRLYSTTWGQRASRSASPLAAEEERAGRRG